MKRTGRHVRGEDHPISSCPRDANSRAMMCPSTKVSSCAHISSGDCLHGALCHSGHGDRLRSHSRSLHRSVPKQGGRDRTVKPSDRHSSGASIAPCQQTPLSDRLCDTTGQGICNNGFQSCNNACIPSTATTAAQIQSQASCSAFCCTKFKQCLSQRQCDISTITATNCSETQGF
jgi:hypothetical protein